jgi:hypothetical protein
MRVIVALVRRRSRVRFSDVAPRNPVPNQVGLNVSARSPVRRVRPSFVDAVRRSPGLARLGPGPLPISRRPMIQPAMLPHADEALCHGYQ